MPDILFAHWRGTLAPGPPARDRLASFGQHLRELGSAWRKALVRVTFGLFMSGLVALLVLLYSEILVV